MTVKCGICHKNIPLRPEPAYPDEHTQTWRDGEGPEVYICLECLEVKKAEASEAGVELVEVPNGSA